MCTCYTIDVGPIRQPISSPLHRRGERFVARDEEERGINDVERNLKGLMMGFLMMRVHDLAYRLQRYIVWVPKRISRLLHRVAQVVVCYHENNVPCD